MSETIYDNVLGVYLRDRRARLDPGSLGYPTARRRTPGLRREEVAQRANVSATWYTWLEQGRGGAPSSDVLDRLARALDLSIAEREHLYLLAQRRPPEVWHESGERVSPRLQCVLDSLEFCPAVVKNNIWDILAWNDAASAVLGDYGAIPPKKRNGLRLFFTDPRMREVSPNWQADARFLVSVFRAGTVRAGASKRAERLAADLCRLSPEFEEMWHDHEVRLNHEESTRRFHHPSVGSVALDYSALTVDGQPNLTLMIFTPSTPNDAERVRLLVSG